MLDFIRLKEHLPTAQYQFVNVTFTAAHTDVDIPHGLKPPDPEQVDYTVVRSAQPGVVYHDLSGDRVGWRQGVIRLRSSVAGARVTLLLTVSHEPREQIQTGPTVIEGTLQSFVPSWTNLTLADAVNAGIYIRLGGVIFFETLLVLGASSVVTGALSVSTPAFMLAVANSLVPGQVGMYDLSATARYVGHPVATAVNTLALFNNASPLAAVTATVPFTFAPGDEISLSGSFIELL